MDTGIQLGRRFRALKLWMVLAALRRRGHSRSGSPSTSGSRSSSRSWVDASDQFERVAPVPFSVVCFRARGTDEFNAAPARAVNASGEVFLSHTRLDGRFTLRLAIGNLAHHRTARRSAPGRLIQ